MNDFLRGLWVQECNNYLFPKGLVGPQGNLEEGESLLEETCSDCLSKLCCKGIGYSNSLLELFGKERPFLKEMWKKYWSPIWKVWKACRRKSRFRKKICKDNSLTNYA